MKIFLSLTYVSFSCALDSMSVSEEITIFSQKNEVEEIINLQPKGAEAKAYQIKQVRGIMLKYRLGEQHVD